MNTTTIALGLCSILSACGCIIVAICFSQKPSKKFLPIFLFAMFGGLSVGGTYGAIATGTDNEIMIWVATLAVLIQITLILILGNISFKKGWEKLEKGKDND